MFRHPAVFSLRHDTITLSDGFSAVLMIVLACAFVLAFATATAHSLG